MLIICNKRHPKKLALLLALRTIPCHAHLGTHYREVFGLRYRLLHIARQGILEFDNLPTTQTHQVMMFGKRFHLVVMVGFIEMKLLDQPELLQRLKCPLYRGQTERGLFSSRAAVDLIRVEMTLPVADNIQHQCPLVGRSQPTGLQRSSVDFS
jgi:hypothetical protein